MISMGDGDVDENDHVNKDNADDVAKARDQVIFVVVVVFVGGRGGATASRVEWTDRNNYGNYQ